MSLDGVHGHQAFVQFVGCSRQAKALGERIVEVVQAEPPIQYVVLDNTAGWLTKRVNRLDLTWVGVLHISTADHDRNRRQKAASLGHRVRLKMGPACNCGPASAQVWHPPPGRGQEPPREWGGAGNQRLGQRFDHPYAAETSPLAH